MFSARGADQTARRGRRRNTALVAGATTLAGTLALSGIAGSGAGAAVARQATAHRAIAATPSLSKLESELKTLEVPPTTSTTVTENGSSLFGPLFEEWAAAPPFSTITLEPTVSSSGTGVTDAINGTTNIGASDPYLPATDTTVINIPVVVGAQTVNYNTPGLKAGVHLRLSPTVISNIYSGQITTWNNSAITKLNPGIKIPAVNIVTIHRSDSSGDTFNFLTYLQSGDPTGFVSSVGGPNTTITWPNVPGNLGAAKNQGVLVACEQTPGCITYVGVSYLREAEANGVGYALLENGRKNFVGPTAPNIAAEVAAYPTIPSNGTLSLIYSTSKKATDGYPDVNFEYAIVQPNRSSATEAQAIKAILAWGMDPTKGASTSKFLGQLLFQPLVPNALNVAINLLKTVS